jgi:hypothetical protein
MLIPVNGTREGLFAFVQAMVDVARDPLVVMPNPFYQIYEGAALLAGAQPHFLGNDRAKRLPARPRRCLARCLATLPGAVPVLARQSDRRSRRHRLPAARDRARRSLRLRDRSG